MLRAPGLELLACRRCGRIDAEDRTALLDLLMFWLAPRLGVRLEACPSHGMHNSPEKGAAGMAPAHVVGGRDARDAVADHDHALDGGVEREVD